MQPAWHFSIPDDHPSLAGHFPGRPIVPGVVVLDAALALILADRPTDVVAGLDDVKFLVPVLPGSEVTVTCSESAPGRLAFACAVAGQTVLRGRVRIGVTG
jgi:3-hydroxyacyl-[acyl-carrier-protein] dehydratase